MTGFKTGASDSGLDESDDEDEHVDIDDSNTAQEATSIAPGTDQGERSRTTDTSSNLPWIYERSSITDGREKTVQLHLQQDTLTEERKVKTELESELGETVNKADLREAAYLVGLANLDGVATQLREWGYDT